MEHEEMATRPAARDAVWNSSEEAETLSVGITGAEKGGCLSAAHYLEWIRQGFDGVSWRFDGVVETPLSGRLGTRGSRGSESQGSAHGGGNVETLHEEAGGGS